MSEALVEDVTPIPIVPSRPRRRVSSIPVKRILSAGTRAMFTRDGLRIFAAQFQATVISGASLIILAGLATGVVLTMQFGEGLQRFGAASMIPSLVALTIVRGTGPLLSALLFAGKAGSSCAAELAAMVSTQQIDALKSVGVDPMERVVAPRYIALVLGTMLLSVASIAAGLIGCVLTSLVSSDSSTLWFYHRVQGGLSPGDIGFAVVKAFIFGNLIAIAACFTGMNLSNKSAQATALAATSAVVRASFAVIIADVFLTKISLWLK